jgi:2-C-methyl-D-erythritol 4-phosphate cytidylyltransferase
LYERAFSEGYGIEGNVFTNTLYCDYGKRIYFTKDSETNMKVTTPEDIRLMQAFLTVMEQNGEINFNDGGKQNG